ncbi:sensor histidine kinase [Streptomyces kanamyceticus]|uniref:histidine kinase n=1 Tax=Streptomyces kanamyceticus TaxID=1967 RepID=A0A5J6G5I2_STRKN|nr:ATP-binding protein [Streptomyces kanamyceticus]QEU90223.1 sensor histidine kinase [Streptomyces kanamyceticus]
MSHLRAPAARADRREGGRHGRPGSRAATLPETHIRPQLLRIAVLPAVAVGLSACAAVLFTLRSTGTRPGPALLAVLAAATVVGLSGIVIAAVAADRAARALRDRVGTLRRATARGQADLRGVVEKLRRGDQPPAPRPARRTRPGGDEFDLLSDELNRAHDSAVDAVVQAAQLSSQAGSEQKVEVFVNLARRLQSLVHREISLLDEMESEVEDPELLKGLFHVDHLATRIRRHAENLAVLGGAVSRRQWSNPVSMTEVMRSAIAEVEQYSRVKLVPPIDGTLRGHAVADVIHLLAELVENATVFSAPHTQVLLRANLVTAGLAVEVEDRGLGMPLAEQSRMNRLLADPDQVNVARLLQDGRIGLFVVSALARRHGVAVRLQTNIYGGVQAVLIVPQELLGAEQQMEPAERRRPAAEAAARGAAAPGDVRRDAPMPSPGGAPDGAPPRHDARAAPAAAATPVAPVTHAAHAAPAPAPAPPAQPVATAVPPHQDLPGRGGDGAGPAPLPVRGARGARPTPADAVPGIRPTDRPAADEHAGALPTPRNGGAVRGRVGKPQLPKRRAQEHLAPQLRDAPAPRPDAEHPVGHDPGLMAAFQRGIGLAQAQDVRDPTPGGRGSGVPHDGSEHGG